MAKRMLADVLWDAANVCLHETAILGSRNHPTQEEFSCHAFQRALYGKHWRVRRLATDFSFIKSLGCNPDHVGFSIDDPHECQGVRYMWLLLAMYVAEDEGLTA